MCIRDSPTEILAEQHYRGLRRLLEPLGIHVVLLTGSTPAGERAPVLAGLADGTVHIGIGPHALIQPTVELLSLIHIRRCRPAI